MPFRFALQTLLRFRESLEHQHELRLQEANLQVSGVERQIEALDRSQDGLSAYETHELEGGISAAQLHFHTHLRYVLKLRRDALQLELVRRRELQKLRQNELQAARAQHQAVATLRENQLRSYRLEERGRQQRSLDELFLLRREYFRRR